METNRSNQELTKANDLLSLQIRQLQAEYEALQNDYRYPSKHISLQNVCLLTYFPHNSRDLKTIKEQAVTAVQSNKELLIEQRERDQQINQKLVKQNEHIE